MHVISRAFHLTCAAANGRGRRCSECPSAGYAGCCGGRPSGCRSRTSEREASSRRVGEREACERGACHWSAGCCGGHLARRCSRPPKRKHRGLRRWGLRRGTSQRRARRRSGSRRCRPEGEAGEAARSSSAGRGRKTAKRRAAPGARSSVRARARRGTKGGEGARARKVRRQRSMPLSNAVVDALAAALTPRARRQIHAAIPMDGTIRSRRHRSGSRGLRSGFASSPRRRVLGL